MSDDEKKRLSVLITSYSKNIIGSYAHEHGLSEAEVVEHMVDLLVADRIEEKKA